MPANQLIDRIRRARQSTVEVGEFRFTIRRPTKYEASLLYHNNASMYEVARDFVVGWSRADGSPLRECDIDLIPSPSDSEVPFDKGLWDTWLQDHEEFWAPIQDEIMAAFQRYADTKEDEAKNS